ncbi:MAG: class I SAM-dependent methyltransferase [Gammaproteobacteria bacterium]|nr:class I SAM-dependent methyltransferase [Gammaproteobacteria bacterium]
MTESDISKIPRIGRESLVLERLPLDGARVIDIGCGEGWLTRLVAPKSVTTVGIDPSAIALERARAANGVSNGTFIQASADNLPFDPDSADVAIYYNSLHHVPEAIRDKALAETARVLARGGLLCIVEPEASGSCFELFRPIDDESAVFATTYNLLLTIANGVEFQQLHEERFIDGFIYRDFRQFLDNALVVDAQRAEAVRELEDELRELFERIGEVVEGGRRYDMVHRLNLLRRL